MGYEKSHTHGPEAPLPVIDKEVKKVRKQSRSFQALCMHGIRTRTAKTHACVRVYLAKLSFRRWRGHLPSLGYVPSAQPPTLALKQPQRIQNKKIRDGVLFFLLLRAVLLLGPS